MTTQQQLTLTVTIRTAGGHDILTRTTEDPEKLLRRFMGGGQRIVAIEGTDGMEHLVRSDAVESVSYDGLTSM